MASGTLIGRDRELDELAARLQGERLVTVVGPGGVGKTALAVVAADRVGHRFPYGVFPVDMTRIDHPEAVLGALAGQLGFDSFESLMASPADRPALLLIDNCEHLIDAVATSAVQVLGACLQTTVLATSRSPLELPGESVMTVAPLAVPRADDDDPASFASVQLFLERVRDAGVDPAQFDPAAVGELCRRLDGLPLALEIAAARSRALGVADILRGLDEGTAVLDRPRFRGAPRHRSIGDTIQWSYGLLSAAAAALLDRLAVFAGPFTMRAAYAVADGSTAGFTGHGDEIERALDELVHASLVTVNSRWPDTTYRLLDTVRRFAADRLQRTGELPATYDRYVDHVVASLAEIMAGAAGAWRPALVRDLVAAFGDIAEALRWCVGHDERPRRAFALCGALWPIVHQAHADDIAALARATLERWPDQGSPSGAMAVASLASAEYTTGQPQRALDLAQACLARMNAPGPAMVALHRVIGQSHRALRNLDASVDAFGRGAAIGHEHGLPAMALELDIAAAIVRSDRGEVERAAATLHAVVGQAEAIGSALSVSWARTSLGWVSLRVDPAGARPLIEQALAEARELDYPVAIAAGLRSRCYAELLAGDTAAAVATASELAGELTARGAFSNVRLLLDVTAVLAHNAGHAEWRPLAASAQAAPITTLLCAHEPLVPLPPVDEPPATHRDSIRLARTVLDELATRAVGRRDETRPELHPDAARLRTLGGIVELTYLGRTVAVRASKGVNDIVALIEADGRDVHCTDLAGVAVEQASTGEVIDATARRRYEDRIRELQAEIDEAEANSDYARSYRHQTELDALIDHLSAALGHGRRTRRAADSAERARSAVTHRIRSALRQLTTVHPPLGRHLSHAISTGVYCSYRPEQPIRWIIE